MRVPVRSLLGPACLALGVWAAAGVLAPASAESSSIRFAAPASIVWLLGAFAGGLAMPTLRRHPGLALPALLVAIPWLPLPLPRVLLIWTGALAWIPVAMVAVAALAAARRDVRAAPEPSGSPVTSAVMAAVLTLALATVVAWRVAPQLPGGDEPHYLVITQSLLSDGDLRIENNHARRDYAPYFGATIDPHFIQRGRDEVIYSIHAPGVPVLVAPLFAAFGYRGAHFTMMLVAAVAGGFIWMSAWLAALDRRAAWLAWAAIVTSTTFLAQSVTIFPDGPGAAVAAVATTLVVALARRRHVGAGTLVAVSAALATLPFFHTRFVVLAAGFGVLVSWQLAADTSRAFATRVTRIATFLAMPMCGAVAWFAYFWVLYGTVNPTAPYGSDSTSSLWFVPGGVVGLMFDQQFGVFTYAPALVLAAAVWLGRRAAFDETPRALSLVALAYVGAVASYWMWWAGGPATPGRLAASVLPLFAVPVAVGVANLVGVRRAIWMTALLVSASISVMVFTVDRGVLAWNNRDAHAAWLTALGSVVDLARVWPSFFWRLDPDHLRSQVPFFIHVTLWVATFTVVGLALSWTRRLADAMSPVMAAMRASWWLPLSLMAAAAISSALEAGTALRPADRQLAIVSRSGEGGTVVAITPGRIRTVIGMPAMRIAVPRADLPTSVGAEWQALERVPAGRYGVRVRTRRPQGGVLALRLYRAPLSGGSFTLARQSEQTLPLLLAGGAGQLRFDADQTLSASAQSIELIPREIFGTRMTAAEYVRNVGGVDVYLLDDRVYVEPDGFWTRGDSSTRLVAVADRANPGALQMQVVNGGAKTTVTWTTASSEGRQSLEPSAQLQLEVPFAADGMARLALTTVGGFRPSANGDATDDRYLGVRVTIAGAAGRQ